LFVFKESFNKNNENNNIVYGEPPPSYKQAKYFPKAPIKNVSLSIDLNQNNNNDDDDDENHIYENIEEEGETRRINRNNNNSNNLINLENLNRNRPPPQIQKKAKFQALKKHSIVNNNQNRN
jgi:hypothetical protein